MRGISLPHSNSHYCCRYSAKSVILMGKPNNAPSSPPNKGPESAPPRITSNVKQNLQFLKLWKEYQKRKSTVPKPATSYRRKKVQEEDLPEDIEIYRDPTSALYYTNQGLDDAVPVLLVDGYNVCGYWMKLKKHFMKGRLDIARQKLMDELVTFSMHRGLYFASLVKVSGASISFITFGMPVWNGYKGFVHFLNPCFPPLNSLCNYKMITDFTFLLHYLPTTY
ncbi:hypothetical protein PTKIN_Ptkin18bG0021300 [Pterospermum kingtungense]